MPHSDGSDHPLASSPKSLSKVSRIRCSRAAHASISASEMPGAAALIQTTLCPAALRAATAAPGKFSFARKRISGGRREYLLRSQRIPRVGETGHDIVVGDARIICQDISLAPPIGHQTDYELDSQ